MNKKKKIQDPIKIAKIFEFYVKNIWPIHRLFVIKKIENRCRVCAASNKMIRINDDGICLSCKSYKPLKQNTKESCEKLAKELNTILNNKSGIKGTKYDVLILFSGGKDSAYLTKRIQLEFPKLKILCLTVDNSFMSPVAKKTLRF